MYSHCAYVSPWRPWKCCGRLNSCPTSCSLKPRTLRSSKRWIGQQLNREWSQNKWRWVFGGVWFGAHLESFLDWSIIPSDHLSSEKRYFIYLLLQKIWQHFVLQVKTCLNSGAEKQWLLIFIYLFIFASGSRLPNCFFLDLLVQILMLSGFVTLVSLQNKN